MPFGETAAEGPHPLSSLQSNAVIRLVCWIRTKNEREDSRRWIQVYGMELPIRLAEDAPTSLPRAPWT